MVKPTEKQRRELEALANMPDDEIDLSDIPERPVDWSKARIAPFYHPKWKEFRLRLNTGVLEWFRDRLAVGQSLDEAISRALRAQMFRIRFPVRVLKAEKRIRRIQESPGEIENLFEAQKQEIEILYAKPISEVVSFRVVFGPSDRFNSIAGDQSRMAVKDTFLNLDENIIDWYEYRLEDGQSLHEALNRSLIEHINWVSAPKGATQEQSE